MEKWKIIDEFPAYQVSSLGKIRRHLPGHITEPGKIRKLQRREKKVPYLIISLFKDGKRVTRYVHRLVAKAFIPNPLNLPEVNHKGAGNDNRAHMLEWRSTMGHARDIALRNQQGKR